MTTRERVQELRADGLKYREIAERLGISLSHAKRCGSPGTSYDSTLAAARASKQRRTGTCERCGGETRYNGRTTNGPSQFCASCSPDVYRTWTRKNVIAAIQRFADEHGRSPHAGEWNAPHGPEFPSLGTVQALFGSWANGIEAAGFSRPRVGYYDRQKRAGVAA